MSIVSFRLKTSYFCVFRSFHLQNEWYRPLHSKSLIKFMVRSVHYDYVVVQIFSFWSNWPRTGTRYSVHF